MPRRYSRQISVDCSSEENDVISPFFQKVEEIVEGYFAGCTLARIPGRDEIFFQISKGTFSSTIQMRKFADMVQVRGQGAIRKTFLLVSAESANVKRKEGRETELSIMHKFIAIFGGVGGCILAGAWLAFNYFMMKDLNGRSVIPHDTNGEVVLFLFALGAAVGGGIGALVGREIGAKANEKISYSDTSEEEEFQFSMKKWEGFIEILTSVVGEFSAEVEEVPSKATIS